MFTLNGRARAGADGGRVGQRILPSQRTPGVPGLLGQIARAFATKASGRAGRMHSAAGSVSLLPYG